MKSDLIITRIEPHSQAWYEFRKNGIGGSEASDICGLVKPEYNKTIYHYHSKVGDYEHQVPDNPKMFFGRYMEDKIAELWEFYDGTYLGYLENFKNNRKIRTCRNLNGFVVNPKYPWLFGSIDRLINIKGGYNLLTGKQLTTEGILEIKTLSYNASRQWEGGIPPAYLAQIHIYMIIMETDYAELAVLRDGNEFFVEKFNRDEELCNVLINVTKSFWYNRILPAKQAYEKKKNAEKFGNIFEAEKWEGEIQRYEPEPDSSTAYQDFLNERFLKEKESIDGTMELFDLCKMDKILIGLNNIIDERRSLIKNQLCKELSDHGAEVINFDKAGKYQWTERKGAKNRTPLNLIKEKPSEEILMQEFNKIDLNCY